MIKNLKVILIISAILFLMSLSKLRAAYNMTCTQVSISNSTPTEITGNLVQPYPRVYAVKVSNLDTAANLCCSQDASVSCTSGTHHGELVAPASAPPYNWLGWVIGVNQPWYCISNSAGGATNAQVCLSN